MVAPLHEHLRLHGVDLRLGTSVRKFTETDNGLKAQLTTGESIDCGLAVMAVGVRAEVKLASEAGLKIGQTGGIAVDEQMRTSDKNIYAIGDAAEIENFVTTDKALIPLAGPANRQGRIAANNIAGKKSTYKKTQGTSICKVFDLTIAMTGLSEKSLKRSQTKYEKIYVHPSNHAGYYPGASPISLKLLFDSENGTILGAQALGAEGVDKRIDVLATAMRAKMKVNDLADLELCYAPQFGSAKDPVNYAGFVAGNIINGDLKVCHFEDIQNTNGDQILLDVRTPTEFKLASIEGAINIGVDELRDRLGELDKEKEILVFCQVGLRGYLAYRILVQNGFKCRNLTGGYKTYKAFQNNGQSTPAQQKNKETIAVNKTDIKITKELDACGLQCPGPIMKIQQEIEKIQAGQTICVTASDPGFSADVAAWCKSTGNKLAGMDAEAGNYRAIIEKGKGQQTPESMPKLAKDKSIIVFSGDFDKAFASFIIANGAAAMGSNVTMFFTFWGLNVLRKKSKVKVEKNLVEKMFGWMMPRGADKLKLSKMNMGNMGLAMIKGIMKNKNVASLPELIESAKQNGVKLVACAMSMDLMGIRKEEMIEGVELGGVASYLETAENSGVNLFI
jgi:peroxiredoxin family protein/TusA-related sulfurtransferase/rhodanese-related sulfurtransferase